MKISGEIVFGNCVIPSSQIFLIRKNVYAMVNHKPFAEGHVLVCSRREVPKIQDLTEVETIDMFMTAHDVCRKLQKIHKVEYQVFCQNGKDAGQTVPHCHLHLIPKGPRDEPGLERQSQLRTEDDMAKEAESYRSCFEQSTA